MAYLEGKNSRVDDAFRQILKRECILMLERINAAAEADMLAGNPITGAHHRAIEAELKRLKGEQDA